jgi:hypothetical protein
MVRNRVDREADAMQEAPAAMLAALERASQT